MFDLQNVVRPPRVTRTVTVPDHVRIFNLLRRATRRGVAHGAISDLIDSAELVSPQDVAPDVVTMYSRVLILPAGAAPHPREVTLCYPEHADPGAGKVSILTPAGAALFGLRVGDVACWTTSDGLEDQARIVRMLFQPEANGDFTA